jgi:hypothetical protein
MEKKEKGNGMGMGLIILIIALAAASGGEAITGPELTPTPTPTVSPIPVGVEDERVWYAIEEGVENARANGVECDPYLLLAIQQVFTGDVFCDESWKEKPRPNACASEEDVLGMFQAYSPTHRRNAQRYDVEDNVWEPKLSAEVICYFIHDEAHISLNQTREKFISEFVEEGYIYNIYTSDAEAVYSKGQELLELNSKGGGDT